MSHSEAKPFSGGRPAIAAQPVRNASAVLRHPVDQAAHCLHVALAGGVQDCAGAEKQQAFEDGVVQRVEERRGQGEGRSGLVVGGAECQGETETDKDDADVLDGRESEQALQVFFHQGVEDAEHTGDAAEAENDGAGPPRLEYRAGRRRCG